ncbi:MAG: protein-glutamate O-methyltransferase family protein [Chloroflexi bacterium]|nr:protein-glutamate O-methyltransferase family protein [Chloroflexota bacterium]
MPSLLPPLLLTSEPNSFARKTFETRIPRIVNETLAANDFPPAIIANLRALHDEIIGGALQPLIENAPDKNFWNDSARAFIGKTWLDVPWFWAEAFFYRRILEATRYFQPGEWHKRDPYANQKLNELDAAMPVLHNALANLPDNDAEIFRALMHADLWGNRIDLSLWGGKTIAALRVRARRENDHDYLLVDDTARVWEHLTLTPTLSLAGRGSARVDFVCDNAGTEIAFDLALADFLLRVNRAQQIVLHLKAQPLFVSDAMIADVEHTLVAFAQADARELRDLAARIQIARTENRMILTDHFFWTTYHFFHEFPDDLRADLARARLVIVKGDANYRRLIGDCKWNPLTPFALATDYFPAPVVAIRTLKGELIVGLRDGDAERVRAQDPDWLVNGSRGVIQFHKF